MSQDDTTKAIELQPRVERHSNGKLKKGSRLNTSGLDRKKAMMLRNLEGLTGKAIATLGRLLESDNHSAALGAAKEVLDRNLGKVKQSVSVDVTQTHVLHLQALEELAQRKRSQLESPGKHGFLTLEHERLGAGEQLFDAINCQDIDGNYLLEPSNCQTIDTPRGVEEAGAGASAPPTPATDLNSLTPHPPTSDAADDADESKK